MERIEQGNGERVVFLKKEMPDLFPSSGAPDWYKALKDLVERGYFSYVTSKVAAAENGIALPFLWSLGRPGFRSGVFKPDEVRCAEAIERYLRTDGSWRVVPELLLEIVGERRFPVGEYHVEVDRIMERYRTPIELNGVSYDGDENDWTPYRLAALLEACDKVLHTKQ